MSNFTLVWLTDPKHNAIHQQHFTATNPDVPQHVYRAPPEVTWFENDRNHRQWWSENRDKVTTPYVVLFDYDVLCNIRLSIPNDFEGCACINMLKYPHRNAYKRKWDTAALPAGYLPYLYAAAPLGILLADRAALDTLLLPEHAHLYERRIWCEDRLPTVMAASGITLHSLAYAANDKVWEQPYRPGHRGIFHRVKRPVNL